MNDTVRLGLLLRKLRILLFLNRLDQADHLLQEVESMLELSLKNRQVLLYMEDEYKLLTYYYHSYLDVKSEYHRLMKQEGACMDCMFKSLVERSDPEIRRYLQRGIEDKVFRKDARLDFYSEEADSLGKNGPEPHSSTYRLH